LSARKRTRSAGRTTKSTRRRLFYTKPSIIRSRFLSGDDVHKFRRNVQKGSLTASAVGPAFIALNFALSDVPSSTDFTTLFDQYRIDYVVIRAIPVRGNVHDITAGTNYATTLSVIDYDDSTTPASMNELREFETVMSHHALDTIVRTVRPRIAVAAYSGVFTSFANVGKTWIDVASPSVQHYGCKIGIDTCVAGALPVWQIECTYFIHCRNSR